VPVLVSVLCSVRLSVSGAGGQVPTTGVGNPSLQWRYSPVLRSPQVTDSVCCIQRSSQPSEYSDLGVLLVF